jgi:hypothetical protein
MSIVIYCGLWLTGACLAALAWVIGEKRTAFSSPRWVFRMWAGTSVAFAVGMPYVIFARISNTGRTSILDFGVLLVVLLFEGAVVWAAATSSASVSQDNASE